MVPHLVTALNGPLLDLEGRILEGHAAIERWFRLEWQEHTPPFYCSVDLRNAGFKLAPVDTNLFPGGFNNLPPSVPLAVQAAMAAIDKICPDANNLLLIPERHTRNAFYLQNVARLMQIMRQAGLHVRFGTLSPEITEPTAIELCRTATSLMLEPLERTATAPPRPEEFRSLHDPAQQRPVGRHSAHPAEPARAVPAAAAARRLGGAPQENHFAAYDEVAKKFAKLIDIDPWMINPFHTMRQNQFPERPRRGMPGRQRRRAAGQDPQEVQGIRHQHCGVHDGPAAISFIAGGMPGAAHQVPDAALVAMWILLLACRREPTLQTSRPAFGLPRSAR